MDSWREFHHNLSEIEKRLRQAAFDSILAGMPLQIAGCAGELGISVGEVKDIVNKLKASGHVTAAEWGIYGSWGLTLKPSANILHMNGRTFYGWCPVDIIGIPAKLGVEANIQTKCQYCWDPLFASVKGNSVVPDKPFSIWLIDADPEYPIAESC